MNIGAFLQKAMTTRVVQVVVPQESGGTLIPIWISSTLYQVFIRSYRADKGRWFQYVIGTDGFSLELGSEIITVKPARVADPITLTAVDAAYSIKHAEDEELANVLTPGVVATTLALTPLAFPLAPNHLSPKGAVLSGTGSGA